ncbi:MAG: hypothetical protein IPK58_10260 [Acidobacteria bacterium]|nr:hypothetical protein [Acidobacteriota bacterium]
MSGETRPRLVSSDPAITPCTIIVSQDVISIVAGGGDLGVLAGLTMTPTIRR